MSSPYQLTEWAFDNAWQVANSKSRTSDSLFTQAISSSGGAPKITPANFNFTPQVMEPLVDIPFSAKGASTETFFELSTAVINQLAGLFTEYMGTYFPDDMPYLHEAESWIIKAMTTGGTGLSKSIEDQIWQRDRSRIIGDATRLEAETIATWAGRRYPLPPGAATSQLLQIRLDSSNKVAQASRDVAIKQAEMELANVKFAVEQSFKFYGEATGSAMEYIKALSVGPSSSMQIVPSITDSQSKLIGAANSYYQSRLGVEELRLKASMPSAEWDQQSRMHNADLVMAEFKNRIDAAVSAAQSLGTQAASALNSLHASASISGSTSNSVGYSYSNDTASSGPTPAWAG